MSTRVPRASAVKAAEFIQMKVASEVAYEQSSAGANETKTQTTVITTTVAPSSTTAIPPPPPLPPANNMPPPSDDEAMPGEPSGGSSEEEMDGDEIDEDNDTPDVRRLPAGMPFADRDDNTLTVEELRLKYSFGEATRAESSPSPSSDDKRAARRAARKAKKKAKKEKRRLEKERRRLEGTDEEEEEESEEEANEDDDNAKSSTAEAAVDDDDDDDEDDGDFALDNEDEDEDEGEEDEEPVFLLPAAKSSRVGPRFQSDLPDLLSPSSQSAERQRYNSELSHLEGEPNPTVYVAPIESPEDYKRRMNELAERQHMQRLLAEEREARRRAIERERAEEEQIRRKKEQQRQRREEEAAARAQDHQHHHHHHHHHGEEAHRHKKRKVEALIPNDLPPTTLHGNIISSFPSSAEPDSRYFGHYVSLFNQDQTQLVGIAFERAEFEEAQRHGKTFRQFLQEKIGTQ